MSTLKLKRDNTIFNRHNINISTVCNKVGPHFLENCVNVLGIELKFLGWVQAGRWPISGRRFYWALAPERGPFDGVVGLFEEYKWWGELGFDWNFCKRLRGELGQKSACWWHCWDLGDMQWNELVNKLASHEV